VPVIGAGTTADVLPLPAQIAQILAGRYNLQLDDARDLTRVIEAAEIRMGPLLVRGNLAEIIRSGREPDFFAPDEPHALLAALPVALYVTANYDSLLEEALRVQGRQPRVEIIVDQDGRAKKSSVRPTLSSPLIVHLYGHASQPASLVLTQDDFLEATVKLAKEEQFINPYVMAEITDSTLLAIGISPTSWQWRVFRHGLLNSLPKVLRRRSFMVLLPPTSADERDLLERQLEAEFTDIYWGTSSEFAAELYERWQAYKLQN
jgi:hypothetical protein